MHLILRRSWCSVCSCSVRPGSSLAALCVGSCGETPGQGEGLVAPTPGFYLWAMSVRLTQTNEGGGIYFITFTCYRWKPLFAQTQAYDAVYRWFDYLTGKRGGIIGYVIMPNHLHLLVYLPPSFSMPNTVVGNAKRFLSYEIIKRLEATGTELLLQELHAAVKKREAKKGQIHRVFEESFDCKPCYSPHFITQKLTYMHHNPVKGKWNLVNDFALYPHSSAGFYHGTGATVYQKLVRVEDVVVGG